MRDLRLLDAFRNCSKAVVSWYGSVGDESCGVFDIPSPIDRQLMCVIASSGEGWDHVSVSRTNRCPNWPEMAHIYGLFFRDDETAMQLHVPNTDHINHHPNCLHLWRPIDSEIPRPPAEFVGPSSQEDQP